MEETPVIPDSTDKKIVTLFISILVVVLVIAGVGAIIYHHYHHLTPVTSSGSSVPIEASITPTGFTPQTIEVNKGQSVVWTNYDSKEHTVSSNPYPIDNGLAGFKSQDLTQDQTYSFVFDQAGTYSYHDDLNPLTFKGIIIVK